MRGPAVGAVRAVISLVPAWYADSALTNRLAYRQRVTMIH